MDNKNIAVLAIGRYGCHSTIMKQLFRRIIKPIHADLFIVTDQFNINQIDECKTVYGEHLKNIYQLDYNFIATFEEYFCTYFGPFRRWLNDYINQNPDSNKVIQFIFDKFNKLELKPYKPINKSIINSIPDNYKTELKTILENFSPYQGLRQWYKIYYGIKKIEKFQIKNNKKYHSIFKIRLDQPPINKIDISYFNKLQVNQIFANWDYNFYGTFETMKKLGELLYFSKMNYKIICKTSANSVDFSLINNCLKNFTKNNSGNIFNFYSENLLLYFLIKNKIQYNTSHIKFDLEYYKKKNPQINFIFRGNPENIQKIKKILIKTNFYYRVIFCSHSSRNYLISDLKKYFLKNTNYNISVLSNNIILDDNLKLSDFLEKTVILQIFE